jgi:L-lactate dehydrogenase (cytochrome)
MAFSEGNVPFSEVCKHNTKADCWIIVNKKIYDVSEFVDDHPGGAGIMMEVAGTDATKHFLHAHPESIMTLTLGPKGLKEAYRGNVDATTLTQTDNSELAKQSKQTLNLEAEDIPPLRGVLNLHDIEAIAQRVMVASGKKQAWDYYSSGADDELTYHENVNAFQRIWLKPRILVDVKEVDTSCSILGTPCAMPVYLSAVAMCGMGHNDGECAWVRAAHEKNVIFMVPSLSSRSFEEILAARGGGQVVHLQIYVNPDREVVLEQIRSCEKHGIRALCITVDSAVTGKRERDQRNKIAMELGREKQLQAAAKGTTARKPGSFANRDAALNWSDIAWFRKNTNIPIVLKGVQTGEDAVLAAGAGVSAIILSNHGGRNCDTCRSGIEVLPEVIEMLKEQGVRDKLEVWVDGGVRRGTDIFKALCIGADAVGLGKPAVYAMSAYGQEGIEKMLAILHSELVTVMKLCGAPTLAHAKPSMVNAVDLSRHWGNAPITPSPYAIKVPPEKGIESIRRQIRALQTDLDALEAEGSNNSSRDRSHAASAGSRAVLALVWVMMVSVLHSVFAMKSGGTLHRSALFLIVFLVVHMLGNLTLFFGQEAFNSYGHNLNSNPFLKFVEAYLALGFVAHIGSATLLTYNKRKFVARDPMQAGMLAITGTLLAIFVVFHLKAFRFGAELPWRSADGTVMRDLYTLQLELFKDPLQVAFYLVSIFAMGVHLSIGWKKAVIKMQVDKALRPSFVAIGASLNCALCIGFAACPVYAWYLHLQQQQQGGSSRRAAAAAHAGL